jgi:PhnB protein
MQIPKNHQAVMPYLMLNDSRRFIEFAKSVFDAVPGMQRMRDDNEGLIMHAEISIQGITIMFADTNDQWPVANANLFVYVDDADIVHQRAIDHGASTIMDLSDQDYGRTCGVLDPFGNTWWITSIPN